MKQELAGDSDGRWYLYTTPTKDNLFFNTGVKMPFSTSTKRGGARARRPGALAHAAPANTPAHATTPKNAAKGRNIIIDSKLGTANCYIYS